MTPDARKRVAAAFAAIAAYGACGSSDIPAQHTAHGDLPKLDYARPATIEDAGDYALPPRPKRKVSRSRPRPPARNSSAAGDGCSLDDIKRMESGGNYTAQNPRSTASGAYQVLNGTWAGYGGYRRAADAPPEVQDQFARELYARRGSQPWVVCR